MKKLLLNVMTVGFVITASAVIAQPILTAAGINPVIGESFTLNNGVFVSPGTAGPGQTWNLAAMGGTSAGLTNVVSPGSTASGASFPGSNVACENLAATTCNYYNTSSTVFTNTGIKAGSTLIPYSNPEDFLHFPFAYTNSYTDTWAGQFTSSGYTFYRTGSTTVTADGYGTLITPNGTYNNVMRVHFVQVYQDSAYIGTPYVTTYNNDEYMWYSNGIHVQVALVYTLTSSAGGPYTGSAYVTGSVGINETENTISSFELYPNPVGDLLNINLSLTENKEISVIVYNELGQKMDLGHNESISLSTKLVQLNVATLPKGIYFATVMLDGVPAQTKRFVVSE